MIKLASVTSLMQSVAPTMTSMMSGYYHPSYDTEGLVGYVGVVSFFLAPIDTTQRHVVNSVDNKQKSCRQHKGRVGSLTAMSMLCRVVLDEYPFARVGVKLLLVTLKRYHCLCVFVGRQQRQPWHLPGQYGASNSPVMAFSGFA